MTLNQRTPPRISAQAGQKKSFWWTHDPLKPRRPIKHPRPHQQPCSFFELFLDAISGDSCAANKIASQAGQANQACFILCKEFKACRCPRADSIPRPEASDGEVHDQTVK